MGILIGLDVGTSGLKALAVDEGTGATVASVTESYPLETPRPGYAEQDPADFERAGRLALARLTAALGARRSEVRAIGLSGQMHSSILLDASRRVVRPAILWCDTRTSAECAEIRDAVGGDRGLRRLVGNRALEGFTLPKLLWVRKHEPAAWERTARVLLPKDYLGLVLTGEEGTDASDASGTLAFDPGARAFSAEICAAVGIDVGLFPPSGESTEPLGRLRQKVAEETGLPEGILVARGAADNAAGAVGLGVVRPGVAMASLGTSGVVLAPSASFVVESEMRLHSFCHAEPGGHYLMGVMLAAGLSLRWYRDVFGGVERALAEARGEDPYDVLAESARASSPGSVFFLPYLMGERTPHADPHARGAFIGLSASTSRADATRAVFEGIAFGLADALALVDAVLGEPVREIRLTGGGAKSPFFRELLANVFGREVTQASSTEGPAFGAALLAGVASGAYPSVRDAAERLVRPASRVAPDPSLAARYAALRAEFGALYAALAPRFAALA